MNKNTSLIKHYNLLQSLLWGGAFLFLQIQTALAEPVDTTDSNSWTIWSKPRICVLPSERLLCKMQTDIFWSGEKEDDICLLSSPNDTILQCWSGAIKGQITQTINSDKQIAYWLTHEGENKVLVKTMIRIIRFPQKKIRRRRRHVWSLL
ncbi:MAG: DUF3019 domain-containing protein [Methylococcales bacterium]|nr:DUF3019 domain-containing protein [Methylococcales bacterium]